MGPLTQLLELQEAPMDAVAPARRTRVRVRISGTLLWWCVIPTAWTGTMVALSLAVRF